MKSLFWLLKQFELIVVLPAGASGTSAVPLDVELLFSVTSPPITRPQTPPPGWFGAGFDGAETKALPCWPRKMVLMLPMAPASAPETAAAGAAMELRLLMPPTWTKLQFGVTATAGG